MSAVYARREWRGRAVRALAALCLVLGAVPSAGAGAPTTVVLAGGLAPDDLNDPAYPHLYALAHQGAVGLLNTSVSGTQSDLSAMLTLALGFPAAAAPTDADVYLSRTEWVEGASAAVVYERRTGRAPMPSRARDSLGTLVHLGIGPLVRRGLAGSLAAERLSRGAAVYLATASSGSLTEAERRAALLAVDARGVGAAVPVDSALFQAGQGGLCVIVAPGDVPARAGRSEGLRRLDAALAELPLGLLPPAARVLLLSPTPRGAATRWRRLSVAALAGPGVPIGLLTSATTRTAGLVANVDIVPALLVWHRAPAAPRATGHHLAVVACGAPVADVLALDRRVRANTAALDPLMIVLGACVAMVIFGGVASSARRSRASGWYAAALLALLNMPLAMLLAAGLGAVLASRAAWSALAEAAYVVALMLGCAAAETAAARALRRRCAPQSDACSAPVLAAWATLAAVLVDAAVGQPLVRFSLLSSYQLAGIRFYGIGNEYMGVTIAAALLAAFAAPLGAVGAGLLWALTAACLGLPGLGANAGGAVAAVTAFGTGWQQLRGIRLRVWHAALWAAAGLAMALAIAAIDRLLPGGPPTHLGSALQTADERGWGYLVNVVLGKAAMNARIATHPAILVTVLGLAALALAVRSRAGQSVRAVFARHPGWARALPAAGYGALAAFVFNDSGAVAAIFLAGVPLVVGLYYLFSEAGLPPSSR